MADLLNIPTANPADHSGVYALNLGTDLHMMDLVPTPIAIGAPATAPAPATMPGKEMHSYLPQIQEGWLNKPLTPGEVILAVVGILIIIGLLTVISKWIFA